LSARVLLHHQPAADIEHQACRDENDDAFHDVAVLARIQDRKQPGRDKAGGDGGKRAAVERLDAVGGAGLGEIARECCDHQQRLEAFAEQNDGSLNECGRHDPRPCVGLVVSLKGRK
jgi:hypothetical protein